MKMITTFYSELIRLLNYNAYKSSAISTTRSSCVEADIQHGDNYEFIVAIRCNFSHITVSLISRSFTFVSHDHHSLLRKSFKNSHSGHSIAVWQAEKCKYLKRYFNDAIFCVTKLFSNEHKNILD